MGSVESVAIENRREEEVLFLEGRRIAPRGVHALNPAFDVTPPENVTAIVTERGVLWPPYETNSRRMAESSNSAS
jgi:methylthioribose-1-phosphate isomerase